MDDKFGGLSLDDINNAASFNDAAGASSNNHAVPPAGGTPNYGYPPPPNNRRPGPAAQIQKPDAGKKNKSLIIVISIIAAALVIAGIIVGAVFLFSNKKVKDSDNSGANTNVINTADINSFEDAIRDKWNEATELPDHPSFLDELIARASFSCVNAVLTEDDYYVVSAEVTAPDLTSEEEKLAAFSGSAEEMNEFIKETIINAPVTTKTCEIYVTIDEDQNAAIEFSEEFANAMFGGIFSDSISALLEEDI